MAPTEKPKKFTGIDFKRRQQKMFFYLTTLCLQRFTSEDALEVPEGTSDKDHFIIVEIWKHSDFLCRNYILSGLQDDLYNVYSGTKTSNKLVVSQVKKLQVIIHDLLAEEDNKAAERRSKGNSTINGAHIVEDDQNNSKKRYKKSNQPKKKFKGKCFNCGKIGHKSMDYCAPKKGKKKDQSNMLEFNKEYDDLCAMLSEYNLVGNPHEWWMDSGATLHVCANKELFSLFAPAQVEEMIYMVNSAMDKVFQLVFTLLEANVNLNHIKIDAGDDMESHVGFHMKDEAERLIEEIELMMNSVKNSKFYAEILLDLKQHKRIRNHLIRLLGSHPHVQVVIYGLGSIESNYVSQFQLAVLLQLKREFSNWISDIEIYYLVMSPVDIIVFKELGLEVLTIDENCKRTAQRPIMFYMPNPYNYLIGNLLGANWSASCLNQIFLLTNSLCDTLGKLALVEGENLETMICLQRILQFTTEIAIKTSEDKICSCIPIHSSQVKLNIYCIGTNGDQPGRFGGVFQDHEGKWLARYKGNIDTEDDVTAGLVALRLGMAAWKERKWKAEKLIGDSDNFMLVQNANGLPEPNENTKYILREILDLLKFRICAVYHVYKETNEDARNWALKDKCPKRTKCCFRENFM
ncbi:hypothetical protein BC332_30271 [Capsicum chinense]|nr:hypothetical protein BC332_30271 [Capsicum chinense]